MGHIYRDENGEPISVGLYSIINGQGEDVSHVDLMEVIKDLHYRLSKTEVWIEESNRDEFERNNY